MYRPGAQKNSIEGLAGHPLLVREPQVVLGDYDVVAKINVDNIKQIGEFLQDVSRKTKGVVKTDTLVSLSTPEKVNTGPVHAYMGVNTVADKLKIDDIAAAPGVQEAHLVLGPYDVVCEVRGKSENITKSVLATSASIGQIDGVLGITSFVVIRKEDWPDIF